MIRLLSTILCFLFTELCCYGQSYIIDPAKYDHPVRVACVGASTTYGGNIENNPLNSFPAQLNRMLGDKWDVRNLGVNSTGILKKGEFPYWNTEAFKVAQVFLPDIVILSLGVNDSKPVNWQYKADFLDNYNEMIDIFQKLPSHPKVYLCREIPVFEDKWGITASVVNNEIDPMKFKLAKKRKLPIIDLYTPLKNYSSYFPDAIHPDGAGATLMAKATAEALTGKTTELTNTIYPGGKSQWSGFDRYDFQYDLLEARLVVPHTPAKGNPWVWRASFPDWHTEMDSILLSKGFAIFFLNTNDMFGSPKAISYWNNLYNYLTSTYQFNKKLALEGVSRGALYIYNFAKAYPERVTCLYAEAPVCDIKSWPGGKKKAPADPENWKMFLNALHLTEAEAMEYKGNPVDSLERLAAYKIPIWHSIGLQDELAPPEENTFVLADKYVRLGGIVTIYPNTKEKATFRGHHFLIDDPNAGADFIMYNFFRE